MTFMFSKKGRLLLKQGDCLQNREFPFQKGRVDSSIKPGLLGFSDVLTWPKLTNYHINLYLQDFFTFLTFHIFFSLFICPTVPSACNFAGIFSMTSR